MREVIRGLDSNMPVYDVRTIEDYFENAVAGSADVTLYIVGSMGLTGLLLAMMGLYGLVAYSVSRRTREFGIRMAIGANKASVLQMVLLQGTLLCFAGIILGIALSLPASRVLQSVVFGASSDWMPYVVVPILLMLVTLVAVCGPALRASMIDPMKALRDE
jgi:ABC-type antimicrobial peptide transport system permease subunit